MPKTRTIVETIYKFNELSDAAKEKVREWCRKDGLAYEWWDGVYMTMETAGEMLGIEFDRKRTNNPKAKGEVCIWFSGFNSQGDGACFEGSYRYKPGANKAVRKEFPQWTELHEIADELMAIQSVNCYQLYATVKHTGRYSHEHSTNINVDRNDGKALTKDAEDLVQQALREFMRLIYRSLEKEHDYLNSAESIDETLVANGYVFYEDGRPA